ncbi:Helix-loop-helix protein hlh-12 [Caenorhabditis elegans]|uniref:Helix-loop-helix protein hlh-12 n=1 Tax=Caenorhabditis elegans TaxID=6239 RepID=HLH12_CAEEL|nr:Helix-loop-helix protein hlh-12 [Caenorhabditis elegans]Q18277.1 RecName: Full=Helix-loop-helix protein hlh-12 [Caenorhabditis elegans]CCD64010.1 Helix-loop-helix protein hlh-12 [Caenorhabditis elegans]|eukprot:NP_501445.1 Helix Loop Helix [Caenorhabditis elegans]
MAKKPRVTKLNTDRRSRANERERQRVSEMNGMFDVLLNLLPPSHFKTRLSRVQILREATSYIIRLHNFLIESSNSDIDAITVFPHIFNGERKSNKDAIRRPMKLKQGGGVAAFISRHELPPLQLPNPVIPILKPTSVPVWPQTNVYIAYF